MIMVGKQLNDRYNTHSGSKSCRVIVSRNYDRKYLLRPDNEIEQHTIEKYTPKSQKSVITFKRNSMNNK
jgi:hypothetical protein